MKNTCRGIKSIIFLKTSESESLKTIVNSEGEFRTNPIDTANSFNNFFCSVASNIQSTLKQTFKPFHHYLTNTCVDSFLISSCTKEEIIEIISIFDNNNATGNDSITLNISKFS